MSRESIYPDRITGTQEELETLLAEGLASQDLPENEFWQSVNTQTNTHDDHH